MGVAAERRRSRWRRCWSCRSLIANPIFEQADVGRLPIANGLLLAYAVPAGMAALARRWIDVEPNRNVDLVAEAAASILAFVYVSLEVRHFFDPGFERRGLGAEGLELYAYSIVWLLFGVALLALGFCASAAALRHAGMALVCIVVAKVFLIDMAGLQGPAARLLVPGPGRGAGRPGLRLSPLRIRRSTQQP